MKQSIRNHYAVTLLLTTTLTAWAQPTITNQPQNQTNVVDTTATFTVGATGAEPLAYQWQKRDYLFNVTDLAGCTNAAICLTNVQPSHAGDYRVVVTNLQGSIISDFAHLAVVQRPVIVGQPTNWPVMDPGGSASNRVVANGLLLNYQWCLNGAAISGQTKSSIILMNLQVADSGAYTVVVTNLAGAVTSRVATLLVGCTFAKITNGPVVTDTGMWLCPSWWDYDSDGFPDLYIAQNSSAIGDAIYHNNGDGTFTRVTNVVTTPRRESSEGVIGDFNNDGYEDLAVVHFFGADDLYRNEGGGQFSRLSPTEAGPPVGDVDLSLDVGWADYDRDGFLDLFAVNGWRRVAKNCLYRNTGDGRFTKMTTNQVGMLVGDLVPDGSVAWADCDNDGWPDLWVGGGWFSENPGAIERLWHNKGDGTFEPVLTTGSLSANASPGVGYWGDYDNNGFLDLFISSFLGTDSLHRNLNGPIFTNVTETAGISDGVYSTGAAWGDWDNDGWLDLIVVRYHAANAPTVLYHNDGDGTFTSLDVGSPIRDGDRRVMPAWADYDNDGFLDLLITCGDLVNGQNLLYRNNGNSNQWLKVKLVGTASNRSAIGAKVRVKATIRGQTIWQMREISGNSAGSGGGGGLLAHFGLGDAATVETIRIEWPSGAVQELKNAPVKQTLTIAEHQEGVTTEPSLGATRSAEGAVKLTLTGQTKLLYVFQASTNLMQWTKLGVRTNLTGTVEFTDTAAAKYAQRFYRGMVP